MQKTIILTLPADATINVNGTTIKAVDYKAEKSLNVFTPTADVNNTINPSKQALEEAIYLIGVEELKKGNSAKEVTETLDRIKNKLAEKVYSLRSAVNVALVRAYKFMPERYSYLVFYRNIDNATCKADSTLWRYCRKNSILGEDFAMFMAMRVMLYYTVKELNITAKTTKANIKKAFLEYAYNKLKPFYQNGTITANTFAEMAEDIKNMVNTAPVMYSSFTEDGAEENNNRRYYRYFNAIASKDFTNRCGSWQCADTLRDLQYMCMCLPHVIKFMRSLNSYKPQPLEQKIAVDYNPFS